MVIWGALLIIINTVLIKKVDFKRICKNVIFMILFSYLWMLHPADDLMQIVRFKFSDGNSTKAMFAVYLPAIIIVALHF